MKAKPTEPLRGDAAWRAEVQEIAKRNEAARTLGVRQRAEKDATRADEAAERSRSEMRDLRDQAGR
jgi:hypothetical protein